MTEFPQDLITVVKILESLKDLRNETSVEYTKLNALNGIFRSSALYNLIDVQC